MTRSIGPVALVSFVLAGELACVLVDNPNHDGLASDTGTETTSDSSGDSSGDSTSETDSTTTTTTTTTTTDTTETTEGEWCPPGQAGEAGCPCNDADSPCDQGLNCVEGVCAEPSNCPPEDTNVLVKLDPMNNGSSGDTDSGVCELITELDEQGVLIGSLSGCLVGSVEKSEFSFGPLVLGPDDPPSLIGSTLADVDLWVISADQRFIRVTTETFAVWIAIGPALDSGDPALSDYPVPLTPASGDCPALPEPCGTSQRKAVQAGDTIVFDGNTVDFGNVQVWVDEARTVCGVDSYRVAVLAF